MFMNILQTALKTAFLALCCFSAAVHATVMTLDYSESFSFDSNNQIFDHKTGRDKFGENKQTVVRDSQLLSISRFDSSLGELLDVNIWFETDWSLGAVVKAYHKTSGRQNVSGVGRSISRQTIRLIDPEREVERNREVLRTSCRGLKKCSSYEASTGQFNDLFDLTSFTLSDFIGNDDLDFSVVRTLVADLTSCGRRSSCTQTNKDNAWSGDIFVSYVYDSAEANVPEPSTLILLGLGLLGIGATRLSRKRNV
jgi:hypothetical protein